LCGAASSLKLGIYLAGQEMECIIAVFTEEPHYKPVESSSHLHTLRT
jgi:hypothetical protein